MNSKIHQYEPGDRVRLSNYEVTSLKAGNKEMLVDEVGRFYYRDGEPAHSFGVAILGRVPTSRPLENTESQPLGKVIAVSGWKGSGKDLLAESLEGSYQRNAFADILKQMVMDQYGLNREQVYDQGLKEKPLKHLPVKATDSFTSAVQDLLWMEFRNERGVAPGGMADIFNGWEQDYYWTPRALCILEGSVKRSVNSAYWVQRVIDKIKNKGGNHVITDMRYRSEMVQLRKAFGEGLVTVRVNRHIDIDTKDPSERDLDQAHFDQLLENKGTKQEFVEQVRGLFLGVEEGGKHATI